MAFNLLIPAVAIQDFTGDGNSSGLVTVADTLGYQEGQVVTITGTALATLTLVVKRVNSGTTLNVGPIGSGYSTYTDLSDYTVAASAKIVAAEQVRPTFDLPTIQQATFSPGPVSGLRAELVDSLGNPITADNPLPTDASVSIEGPVSIDGPLNANLFDFEENGITSQVNGTQRALDVGVNVAGVQVDPRAIRALTASDVVTVQGGATAAKQDTGNTSLASIDTKLTSQATAAKQDTGNTSLGSIDTKLSSQATAAKQDTQTTALNSIITQLALPIPITYGDASTLDAFGRVRVSHAVSVFESQFTYNLQPLILEPITSGTGASVSFNSTDRCADMAFSSTASGGKAYMQSYEHLRYVPGRSQRVFVTFNFNEPKADTLKFAGYSDGTNGIEFQNNGSVNQFVIYSGTSAGNQTAEQPDWNVDHFDGTGPSGVNLDITKTQIMGLDLQALYTGRVRVGFDVNGTFYPAHEFLAANVLTHPYIQTVNLPIRCGMTCSATVSTTMKFVCSTVQNEGLVQDPSTYPSYPFAAEGTKQAPNGSFAHILSIRPTTTFNSIANRIKMIMQNASFVALNASPVVYQIVLGQAITGTTAFTAVNSTYSGMEFNTAGTASGAPAIVLQEGYISQSNVAVSAPLNNIRAPLTLDAAGAVRSLGTLSVLVQGLGGAVNTRASLNWSEIR